MRRGDQPAGIARFIVTGGSRYAALSKLRVHYDTSDIDSLTATPVSGIHSDRRGPRARHARATPEAEAPQAQDKPDAGDDDEPWKRSA